MSLGLLGPASSAVILNPEALVQQFAGTNEGAPGLLLRDSRWEMAVYTVTHSVLGGHIGSSSRRI